MERFNLDDYLIYETREAGSWRGNAKPKLIGVSCPKCKTTLAKMGSYGLQTVQQCTNCDLWLYRRSMGELRVSELSLDDAVRGCIVNAEVSALLRKMNGVEEEVIPTKKVSTYEMIKRLLS